MENLNSPAKQDQNRQEQILRDFPVSWHELHRDARALAWRLKEKAPFRGLVAVTRGGLVPAAIVARELDIRAIDSISLSSYVDKEKGEIKVWKFLSENFLRDEGKGIVVVDDLSDTGATFTKIREFLPKAHYATIYAKPAGKPFADTYVTEVSQDTWILFPWDLEMRYAKPYVGED